MSGAERPPAIVNATAMLGIGLAPAFHWPILMLAALLGTAVNIMLRSQAKHDQQFFAAHFRHWSYQEDPGIFPIRTRRWPRPNRSTEAYAEFEARFY